MQKTKREKNPPTANEMTEYSHLPHFLTPSGQYQADDKDYRKKMSQKALVFESGLRGKTFEIFLPAINQALLEIPFKIKELFSARVKDFFGEDSDAQLEIKFGMEQIHANNKFSFFSSGYDKLQACVLPVLMDLPDGKYQAINQAMANNKLPSEVKRFLRELRTGTVIINMPDGGKSQYDLVQGFSLAFQTLKAYWVLFEFEVVAKGKSGESEDVVSLGTYSFSKKRFAWAKPC